MVSFEISQRHLCNGKLYSEEIMAKVGAEQKVKKRWL